jgi:hypothetical protein
MRWNAEGRPEFEDRSEVTKRKASEDCSDRTASKHLKSTDMTVGGGGETL